MRDFWPARFFPIWVDNNAPDGEETRWMATLQAVRLPHRHGQALACAIHDPHEVIADFITILAFDGPVQLCVPTQVRIFQADRSPESSAVCVRRRAPGVPDS